MEWVVLPKGVLLGLSVAAPVGPIGVLTIRRTISDGFRMGFATGLGAATADATYGLIAAFGLTAIMAVLTDHADAIRLVGGVMLVVIGVRTLVQGRAAGNGHEFAAANVLTPARSYIQTVGLTLTNPMTILAFIGMFAGIGISSGGADIPNALALVLGVGTGSAIWWLGLAFVVSRIRHRLSTSVVQAINVSSALIIVGFGVAAMITAG
jgi:threonine/homoserine/homoserine lactone efflux protein